MEKKKKKTIAPTISDLLDTCCKTFWSTKHHRGQATDMPFPSQIRLLVSESNPPKGYDVSPMSRAPTVQQLGVSENSVPHCTQWFC